MTWKIFNKLFKWDYVILKTDIQKQIRRIKKDYNDIYIQIEDFNMKINRNTKNRLIWLTCSPEKYLGE